MTVKVTTFLDDYQRALDEGEAALFVGAGLSIPAGFPGWKELLREIATELDLNIDEESDLIALAQYHVNHSGGRGGINRKLMEEFTKDAKPTENHHLIATLPLTCIWTTNYDHLIEDAFRAVRKRVDRKVAQADLARTLPRRDVIVHKMHGDIDRPDEAVLTKADYERYDEKRKLFSVQLRGDLVSKTFAFVGLSFTDPNISYVLARVRNLIGENSRCHYWITLDAKAQDPANAVEIRRQKHRIDDLRSYGIRTVLVEKHEHTTEILRELTRRVHRKNVFLSGSAADYAPFGQERALALLRRLGAEIIRGGFNVVCGMGLGVGDAVAMGAIETVYGTAGDHLDERTILRPFPQVDPTDAARAVVWKRYREEMLSRARTAIFVLGNKSDGSGEIVPANGMREEFEIARRLNVYPIPIGATGFLSTEFSAEVLSNLAAFYREHADTVKPHLETLADPSADDDKLVHAVIWILKTIVPK